MLIKISHNSIWKTRKNITFNINEANVVEGNKVCVMMQQSSLQYDSIRSAISCLYKIAWVPQPVQMKNEFSTFITGSRCIGLREKQSIGL